MIAANDLRIGNYVYGVSDRTVHIVAIQSDLVWTRLHKEEQSAELLSDVSPIPLSIEWLEKFGYKEEVTDGCWYNEDRTMKVVHSKVGNIWVVGVIYDGIIEDESFWLSIAEVSYVHSLQNLIYCLMDEELKITT